LQTKKIVLSLNNKQTKTKKTKNKTMKNMIEMYNEILSLQSEIRLMEKTGVSKIHLKYLKDYLKILIDTFNVRFKTKTKK
jgi:hypothetical protein